MDIRLTMKKVDYLIYNVFISKYVMICETEVVYKNLLTDNLKFILQWKNDFPISQISIIDIDNDQIGIKFLDHLIKYWFGTKILYFDIEQNITISKLLDNIDNNNILTVLLHLESVKDQIYIDNLKANKSDEGDEDEDEDDDENEYEDEDDDENEDSFILFSIGNIINRIMKKNTNIKISATQNLKYKTISVKTKVNNTLYTFILTISENMLKLPIEFEGIQPNMLFKFLLNKIELGKDGVDFETIIPYIANILESEDISPHIYETLNVNNIMIDFYNIYKITLSDYIWNEPSQTCPNKMDQHEIVTKLEILNKILVVFENNKDNIKDYHLYNIYPIIKYYLNTTSCNNIVNNIDQYIILKKIIEILWKKYSVVIETNISIIIGSNIANIVAAPVADDGQPQCHKRVRYITKEHQDVLEFYSKTFPLLDEC